MRNRTIILLIAIIGISVFTVAGYLLQHFKSPQQVMTDDKCIPYPVEIVPAKIPQIADIQTMEDLSPPQKNFEFFPDFWDAQLDKTTMSYMPTDGPVYYNIVVDGKYIWLLYLGASHLARYDIKTKDVELYDIPDPNIPNQSFLAEELYLARDGTLWVIFSNPLPEARYSVLAYYQPERDEFEIVTDQDGLLQLLQGLQMYMWTGQYLSELSDNQLIVAMSGNIYLYNTASNQAKLLLEDGEIRSIAIGNNDRIWFIRGFLDENLYSVDIKDGSVINHGVAPQLKESGDGADDAYKAIAVDQQNRVWISYFDWLEENEDGSYSWHSIKIPSVFVYNQDPFFVHRWADGFFTLVSSDGNIWFTTEIGIVEYDSKNDFWCLRAEINTIVPYPITEDANGSIWTISEGQIYSFENKK